MNNNNSKFQSVVQGKARWLFTLFALLTLGVGQMWADNAGFFSDGASIITYSKNGASDTNLTLNNSGVSTQDFGTVTAFWLKGWQFKMWKNEGGNVCDYGKMYYRIYLTSESGGAFTGLDKESTTWWPNSTNNIYHNGGSLNINILDGLVGGTYYFEYYFEAEGNWNSGSGCDKQYLNNGGSGNYKIQFKYDPKFTVTVAAGSNGSVASTSVTAGNIDAVTLPTASANTGYHFNNWTTESSDLTLGNTTSATTGTVKARAAGTVTANFVENTYSLTFANTDGHGTVSVGSSQVAAAGSSGSAYVNHFTTKTLEATPNTGYQFSAWTVTGTNSSSVTIGSTSTASTTIKATNTGATVTASFTPKTTTITLDKGDHGAANQTATVSYDATALTSITHVAADGMYELTGYFTDGGVKVLNADGSFAGSTVTGYITSDKWSNANAAVTLYAHWDAVSTYSVSYNAGGGTGSMSANTGITAGGSQTISTNSFTRSGYTFSHWTADVAVTANSVAVAAGGTIAAGATLSGINSNIALTAQWTENDYTVTVTAGSNGTVASGSVTGHKDTKVTLPTATANTGYHFDTWTTTSGTVSYDNKTSATAAKVYNLTAAATVRADFAANTYSVAFNANGGTGSMSNEAFTYDASATALTSNSFTRSGYTFLGWATSTERAAALTVEYTDGQSVRNLTDTNGGTLNLYAVWARKYYIGGRLQHDWEDGSSTTNEMTYVSNGRYKFETNKSVNELSVQWHNVSGNYDADQVFFIHTGSGKSGSSSNPFYTTPNEDGAGLNFETSNAYANALVLANQEVNWDNLVQNRCVQFSNTDNLSSAVIIWWEPSTKKIWYTATESLNTNYYLLGFGAGNWTETEARRFTVASVNATTATVSVALLAQTYTYNTDNGFKVKNGSTYYGHNNTMTRANCSGWGFETDKNNCGFTADVAGTYTFELNLSTMAVSVTFPTAYTLTYDIGTIKGTNGTISSSPSTASGSLVLSETSVTLTAPSAMTGYSWKGWYDNAAGTGEALHNQQAYTFTVDDNTTLYACYNETTYAVTLNNGDHGTVSPSGDTQIGSTGIEVTATPDAGWKFNGWSKTGTYVNLSSLSDNPTTVTASGTGSVTPSYIQRYILRGSLKDNSDNAGMAGWSATDNSAYASATIAGNVMTVTANLTKSRTDYKFMIFDSTLVAWRGQTNTSYIPDATQWTLNGGNDVYFRATAIGTYTFAVDFTTADAPAVTVTRPTGFPVNYGFGTIEGASSAPTAQTAASITVNSGDSVQSGTSVTLTAEAAKTGYTWQGWYTTPNTSGTCLSTELAYTTTVSAATTIYAVYTENLYTVTVKAGDNGRITVGSPSVSAGIDTNPTITATANTGYRFSYWEVVTGTATFANDRAATTTVSASSDATIRAVFGSNWVIGGSTATFGNWVMENGFSFANFETVDGKEIGYVNLELPANSEFEVKVFDHNTGGWYGHGTTQETVTYTSNNGTALLFETGDDKENLKIITAGHGTYQFVWNQTDNQLTVNYPTSYTITYGQKTYYGVDESNDATTTGGTFSVVDGDDNALASGAYIVGTQAAVFTAVPATNYSLAGWYKDSEFTNAYVNGEDGAVITTNTLALTPTVNSNVYAKFAENMTTVAIAHNTHGHVVLGGAPVTSIQTGARTTRSITAVADAGYYFAGWTVTSGSDFTPSATGEANTTITITITVTGNGAGETTGQVLTANFVELDKVYFRNIFDDGENAPTSWENVYVYYNAYWDSGDKGAGANGRAYAQMTQIGSSNVYEAYIPRSVSTGGVTALAFSNVDFHEDYNFKGSMAVYRNDYNSQLNMFVPHHVSNGSWNMTTYYSNGYWMQYDTKIGETAGYYLKKRTGNNTYSQLSQFEAITNHATTIQDTLRIDEMGTGNNKYLITSAGGLNYKAASQITSTNCMGIELVEDNNNDAYFEIDPSTEGDYVIQINQDGDKMKLNVIYPISVGDHRLKHTYTNGGTKSTYSDVIKSHEDTKKLSMYIDNTGSHSPSLKLQKCIALTKGVPSWSEGTDVTMTGIKTDTMGVYVFDLAVDGDAGTISEAAPYTGEYYIKADSLPGGWTNFTQNVMILNTNTFDKNKPTTFDRYLCHWYGNRNGTYNTNIKCVVANEYCNQLSDTLFGDAVIGINSQTLPYPGNVRFSYNSTTNEVKRTYINGSSNWQDQFLLLSGSTKLIDKDTRSTFTNNQTTFTDMNNWTYQKDVASYANSNVILTAQFNGQTQLLLGSTSNTDSVQLIGGTPGATTYNIRLVYDFKTDYLIAGYLAGNTEFAGNQAIYSDVLIIREEQNDAEQITFGEGKSLTEVRTVYGVMQFNKSFINDDTKSRYKRNTYWISFPFDVKLSDVVGFGSYGRHWIIQYYDGAARAANGAWIDSPNYWTYVMPSEREAGYTLKAHVGYLLSLSLSNMSNSSNIWDNGVNTVSLYFPSKEPVETINGQLPEAGSFTVPEHPCTIQRDGRYYKDANWNIIGVPSYANLTRGVQDKVTINEQEVPFLYTYNQETNYMDVDESENVTFGAMKAYMVQFAGTIDWNLTIPNSLVARRNKAADSRTLNLNILDEQGQQIDRTFIRLSDESTAGLDMNKDLYKHFNDNTHNLYSLCDGIELGAQILPLGEETLYIPVGVRSTGNGTITFALPEGTQGLEVYLFDREENRHINLLTSTHSVTLPEGKNSDRFLLEIKRAQMPTDLMGVDAVEEGTVKYMQNGHLYIKQGNRLYNAEGKRVSTEK